MKNRVGIAPILENNVPIRKPWSHEITITNDYAISMNLEEFYLQKDNQFDLDIYERTILPKETKIIGLVSIFPTKNEIYTNVIELQGSGLTFFVPVEVNINFSLLKISPSHNFFGVFQSEHIDYSLPLFGTVKGTEDI